MAGDPVNGTVRPDGVRTYRGIIIAVLVCLPIEVAAVVWLVAACA